MEKGTLQDTLDRILTSQKELWAGTIKPDKLTKNYLWRLPTIDNKKIITEPWEYVYPTPLDVPDIDKYSTKLKLIHEEENLALFSFHLSEISSYNIRHTVVNTFVTLWETEQDKADVIKIAKRLYDIRYLSFIHFLSVQDGKLELLVTKRIDDGTTKGAFQRKLLDILGPVVNGICPNGFRVQYTLLTYFGLRQLEDSCIGPLYKSWPVSIMMDNFVKNYGLGHYGFRPLRSGL